VFQVCTAPPLWAPRWFRGAPHLGGRVRRRAQRVQARRVGDGHPLGEVLEPLDPVGKLRGGLDTHDEHPFEGVEVRGHGRVVVPAEGARGDQDPGGEPLADERDLAAAQDRQDRVGHRPDARARQVQRGELPPVRQLDRHRFARLDAELEQDRGEPVHGRRELRECQRLDRAVDVVGDDGDLVRTVPGVVRQVVDQCPVTPPPACAEC
jgi:hypothetical protein